MFTVGWMSMDHGREERTIALTCRDTVYNEKHVFSFMIIHPRQLRQNRSMKKIPKLLMKDFTIQRGEPRSSI